MMIQVMAILNNVITKVIPTNIIKLCSKLPYRPIPSKGTSTPQFEIQDGEGTHTITRNYTDTDDLENYGDITYNNEGTHTFWHSVRDIYACTHNVGLFKELKPSLPPQSSPIDCVVATIPSPQQLTPQSAILLSSSCFHHYLPTEGPSNVIVTNTNEQPRELEHATELNKCSKSVVDTYVCEWANGKLCSYTVVHYSLRSTTLPLELRHPSFLMND